MEPLWAENSTHQHSCIHRKSNPRFCSGNSSQTLVDLTCGSLFTMNLVQLVSKKHLDIEKEEDDKMYLLWRMGARVCLAYVRREDVLRCGGTGMSMMEKVSHFYPFFGDSSRGCTICS
ncbi:uncharacterized protein LOC130720914 isoform X1 [Lotus japonicus]|uniref:uncharacterized protein LOC130720914 isoform X1 n=1 Tax=Lotus japonicus TaxID=34305 RepID=UPI00258EE9A4|nr:uncharacterized protein LOC130720914 isoform X1 [Lotus japonicus]